MLISFRRLGYSPILAVLLLHHFEVATAGSALEKKEVYPSPSISEIQELKKKLDAVESKYATLSEDNAKLIKAILVRSKNSIKK